MSHNLKSSSMDMTTTLLPVSTISDHLYLDDANADDLH